MGQDQSKKAEKASSRRSMEDVSHQLASRFIRQSFTPVEYYSFKRNFSSLATSSHDDVRYWTEETFLKFLSIPDSIGVGPILYRAATYVGSFPFTSKAPAILDHDALIKVVAIFTGKHEKAIKSVRTLRLFFRAFAVEDRQETSGLGGEAAESEQEPGPGGTSPEEEEQDNADDELVVAALQELDAFELFGAGEKPKWQSYIPADTMKKIIMLALLIAPLEPQQPLAAFADRTYGEGLQSMEAAADCVLSAFKITEGKGISYRDFEMTINQSMPYFFAGLDSLFEHFLFSPDLDASSSSAELLNQTAITLLPEPGEILNIDLLSQLSLFIPGTQLWRRLRILYAGSEAGFSMGAFETKVLKWHAPTIFLVSGSRIVEPPENPRERAFYETLPPRRYPDGGGGERDGEVIFGVYLESPWKVCYKECFGDAATKMFQLAPRFEVLSAVRASGNFAYFNRTHPLTFGCDPPLQTVTTSSHSFASINQQLPIAPVSLSLDPALEFAVFNHVGLGGAFRGKGEFARGMQEWQERFSIDEIEVWGCGGDKEAEEQRRRWAWEEREAALRRQINIGKGDIEADRALLEMAGLIGQNRSGGSMG